MKKLMILAAAVGMSVMANAGSFLVHIRMPDGAHMRLIIGYNENDGEILYTDSWGAGHELKRMDAEDALSITSGMYYLKDNPGSGSAAKVEVIEK